MKKEPEKSTAELKQVTEKDAVTAACEAKMNGRPAAWIDTVAIDIRDIYSNERNFYKCDGIDVLAESIKRVGLLENLTVIKAPKGNKKYRIVAGERRWRALRKLAIEEGLTQFMRATCVVMGPADADEEMLRLITTNQYRTKSYAELAQEVRETRGILSRGEAQAEGGRIRDRVAQITGISSTKIAQIDAIENNLASEFKKALQDGGITFSAAYELSGMDLNSQMEAYAHYAQGKPVTVQMIREMKQPQEEKQIEGQMVFPDDYEDGQNLTAEQEEGGGADGQNLTAGTISDEEIMEAWKRLSYRVTPTRETTKDGLIQSLALKCGKSWFGSTATTASGAMMMVDCRPSAVRITVENRNAEMTWSRFVGKIIEIGLFRPAPELVDAHPQAKESICYGCANYENCAQKQTNVSSCDSYVDRKEAEKTDEQRYSEEQDRIDRQTRQKLQQMEEAKTADGQNLTAAAGAENGAGGQNLTQKPMRTMRVSGRMFAGIFTRQVPYMIVRWNPQDPFRDGDTVMILEMQGGAHTGRAMQARIACVNTSETSSGIVEGYAVIGLRPDADGPQNMTIQMRATPDQVRMLKEGRNEP